MQTLWRRSGVPALRKTLTLVGVPMLGFMGSAGTTEGQEFLGQSDWASRASFTNVVGVRETETGLLVADRAERALYLVDWATGESVQVGRKGPGPTEYRGAVGLYPMGPDTTLLIDEYAGWRLIVDGRVVGSHGAPADRQTALSGPPAGVTSDGIVFGVSRGAQGDSATLVAVPRRADLFEVARLARAEGPIRISGSGSMPPGVVSAHPLSVHDEALAFQDGWVAVARGQPYRVDWRRPDGSWLIGPRRDVRSERVTKPDQCLAFRRTFGTIPCDPSVFAQWPEDLPPFLSARLQVPTLFGGPDGSLVVTRTPRTNGTQYEVINRSGKVTSQFHIGPGSFLIGTGQSSIYIVTEDAMGLQHIFRYPWGG